MILMRLVGKAKSVEISVRDAGVRTDFYRRVRPGGKGISYDVEQSLAEVEAKALPLIAKLPENWPPSKCEKSSIGQFFALQYVRGPVFKSWNEGHRDEFVSDLRADPEKHAEGLLGDEATEAIEGAIETLEGDTERFKRMYKCTRLTAVGMCSMQWNLVEFPKPGLVTSDHPVIVWPQGRGQARPVANDLDHGTSNSLEIFVPIGPSHLILMTWRPLDVGGVLKGSGRHLATTNAFVIANAEKQWFHELGKTLQKIAKGPRKPLSEELLPGYSDTFAAESHRRHGAISLAMKELEAPLSNEPLQAVRIDASSIHLLDPVTGARLKS